MGQSDHQKIRTKTKARAGSNLKPVALTHSGFTIVELLIVIIVIGILAAISIVAFNGVSTRATEASMQSDLRNAATSLAIDRTEGGSYPASHTQANGGQGLKTSKGNSFQYSHNSSADSYCLTITNTKGSIPAWHISSDNTAPRQGVCPGHTGATSEGGSGNNGSGGSGSTAPVTVGGGYEGYRGIVADASGNVYLTDYARIYKITPDGQQSVYAGSGDWGFQDGPASSAQFAEPIGITIDSAGNLYVADAENSRIRKIDTSGYVTTVAGSGYRSYQDGPALSAQFNYPHGITIDPAGNLYVAENHRIRKIDTSGYVTTVAGSGQYGYQDGPALSAQFASPYGITIDSAGNLYVADTENSRIRKIDTSGYVTTVAGSGDYWGFQDGPASSAQFAEPIGITIDSAGNLYVADASNKRIRKIDTSGQVSTIWHDSATGKRPLYLTINPVNNQILFTTDRPPE